MTYFKVYRAPAVDERKTRDQDVVVRVLRYRQTLREAAAAHDISSERARQIVTSFCRQRNAELFVWVGFDIEQLREHVDAFMGAAA